MKDKVGKAKVVNERNLSRWLTKQMIEASRNEGADKFEDAYHNGRAQGFLEVMQYVERAKVKKKKRGKYGE